MEKPSVGVLIAAHCSAKQFYGPWFITIFFNFGSQFQTCSKAWGSSLLLKLLLVFNIQVKNIIFGHSKWKKREKNDTFQ